MKILGRNKKKVKMVRIIIGNVLTGERTLTPPTKTLTLTDTNVEEIYKKLIKLFENEEKR